MLYRDITITKFFQFLENKISKGGGEVFRLGLNCWVSLSATVANHHIVLINKLKKNGMFSLFLAFHHKKHFFDKKGQILLPAYIGNVIILLTQCKRHTFTLRRSKNRSF